MAGGRPPEYKDEFAEQAYKLCLLGAKDTQLADFFGKSEQTINAWKNKHPKFIEALKAGKMKADGEVAESLFHRAKGYSHKEDKIFIVEGLPLVVPTVKHYAPDTTACIFWLKNRDRENWRDKVDVENSGEITVKNGGLSRSQQILEEIIGSGPPVPTKNPLPN